jgi:poly(hydroxyalkanoate) granule-associated protein
MSKPKLRKKSAATKGSATGGLPPFQGRALLDSAREIWMAGLGAFGRAQEEGGKLFERLVREGMNLEQKTRRFATGQVDGARDAVENTVATVRERATDTWDKLEKVFEERVSNALKKLGVPGREEMEALLERVEELNREVRKSQGARAPAAKKAAPRKAPRSVKTGVRKARQSVAMMADAATDVQVAATKAVKRAVRKATAAIT